MAKGSVQQRLGRFKKNVQQQHGKAGNVAQTSIRLPTVIEPDANLTSLCTRPFRFVIEPDQDYVGHDINGVDGVKSTSFEHCCAFCGKTVGCKAFTYSAKNGGFCWLKHSKGATIKESAGVVSGYLPANIFLDKQTALEKLLVPDGMVSNQLHTFIDVYRGTPITAYARVSGYRVEYGVYQRSHLTLVRDHLNREARQYKMMAKALSASKVHPPLMVDVGSNQGLYALVAMRIGAQVIAVEPQARLCRLINWSTLRNKFTIGKDLILYQSAILDTYDKVNMRNHNINEGAIGTIVKGVSGRGQIQTHPIADIVPQNATEIAYMKVDVEGVELAALISAVPLFKKRIVKTVVVEFGPPSRWANTLGMGGKDGLDIMAMMAKYQFDIKLLDSQVYATYGGSGEYVMLTGHSDYRRLIDAMSTCECEAYLAFELNLNLSPGDDSSTSAWQSMMNWLWGLKH